MIVIILINNPDNPLNLYDKIHSYINFKKKNSINDFCWYK